MKFIRKILFISFFILFYANLLSQNINNNIKMFYPTNFSTEGRFSFSSEKSLNQNIENSTNSADGWVNIMSQNFEGTFPSGLWQTGHPINYVDAYWGTSTCHFYSGSKSGFCAAAGTAAITCNQLYPNNMFSFMIYGPFDLSDATDAEMTFYHLIYSEYNNDVFLVGASIDGQNFWGGTASGNSNGWISNQFDLKNVYNLGNLCGKTQVWVGFIFVSNYSVQNFGVWVDDILLKKFVPATYQDITLNTFPQGLNIIADGNVYTSPATFTWQIGSSHSIGTNSPQGNSSTRYVWHSWNNSGAMNQNIIVPQNSMTYTANFQTEHYLSMGFVPANSGSVSPQSGWKIEGSTITIQAQPNSNFKFYAWSGSGTGSYTGSNNPETISVNGPINELAAFQLETGIDELRYNTPTEYALYQNFPNPFNPTTRIYYSVPKESQVTIKLYNTLGEEIRTLVNETKTVGNYWIDFNASELRSGVYLYQMVTNIFRKTFKMVLIK